jgi:lipooligosaccharide transport system ATP-binding protein
MDVAVKADKLIVRELRKSFGPKEVIKGIGFAVRAGECFGLLGPNGAGKTTTLRCCLGLTAADSGSIELCHLPIPASASAARSRVGVVSQFDNLDVHLTVVENLQVYGRYFGLRQRECDQRVPRLLEFAGLTDRANASIHSLSGGMKRRLTIARALVNNPEVLFLDEPTTGLDPQARHMVWDRLKGLLAEGRTVVLTSHAMDEVQRLCDRVAIMDRGTIITIDSPATLVRREIEPVVVEVHGDGLSSWLERFGRPLAARVEVAGETAFCYCREAEPLLASLDREPGLRALRRAASLEDVFIKLTGRELRD